LAIEELGPTSSNSGNSSATGRSCPSELIDELVKLQDSVKPFSLTEALDILEQALKCPVGDVFDDFPAEPIASASVAQVYRARLKNGGDAAVKVQRPNIRQIVATDLDIIRHLAGLIERHNKDLAACTCPNWCANSAGPLTRSLTFRLKRRPWNGSGPILRTRRNNYVPVVHAELTSDSVLVTEFVEGIKVSDVDSLKKAGLLPSTLQGSG